MYIATGVYACMGINEIAGTYHKLFETASFQGFCGFTEIHYNLHPCYMIKPGNLILI